MTIHPRLLLHRMAVLAYVTQAGVNSEGEFTVSTIDTASSAVVGDPIEVGSFPTSIAITADGMQAYVGNERSNTVSVIDTASNSLTVTLNGMSSPRAVAASAVSNTLTVTLNGMSSPRGVVASAIPPGHQVPNVIGEKEIDATITLIASGLSVGSVTPQTSDTVPAGKVISQDPLADTYLGSGAGVDLVVSSGRAVVAGGGGGGGATGFELLALLGLFAALSKTARTRPRRVT